MNENYFEGMILDHFCTWLEEVIVPIFNNDGNLEKFPRYVSDGKISLAYVIFEVLISFFRY